MVAKKAESYTVKHRGKTFKISKDELKQKNLDWAVEYKAASPERRGRILSDYYDYNRSFLNYFPQFHGTYRDEIVHTLIASLPKAFMKFNPGRKIDINSYISMFYKKAAVKQFLYLLPTVMYNRFDRDKKTGRTTVLKAHVVSLDHFNDASSSGDGGNDDADREEGVYLAEDVTDFHLRRNNSNLEDTKNGMADMHHHFTGIARLVVEDFENGLRWKEVKDKHKLTTAQFGSLIEAIRIRLTRIIKENGRDAKYITWRERGVNSKRAKQRASKRTRGTTSGAALAGEGFGEDYIQDTGDMPPAASLTIDKLWNAGEEEEDG